MMKVFDVTGTKVTEGIPVEEQPYPHITLGSGGNKRATWVPLGKRDANRIVGDDKKIAHAGVIRTKEGRFLIVAPPDFGDDKRALVLWRLPSGYRGSAAIKAEEGNIVIAIDSSWHSGRGSLGTTAEILVIMEPGARLVGRIDGRRVQDGRFSLEWSGNEVIVRIGDEAAGVTGADGEYV